MQRVWNACAWRGLVVSVTVMCAAPAVAEAQDPHAGHQMSEQKPGWHLMQDGVVFGLFNHQGGPRGGNEFVVPNWWMGAWTRALGSRQIGLTAMFSLDAATVGKKGYREIFQVGEALDGKPLIDRQHPHDVFMQLAATWATPVGKGTTLTLAGGPSGEPTLGPVAFMHRASAAGLVLAPLGHHTFDSTHVSFGVVTASVARGRLAVEGSVFNGREPDEHRWNFDFGAMDSVAGRVWFRPSASWELQISSGRLRDAEELVAGDVLRTTMSASYLRRRGGGSAAFTAAYGVNSAHGERRHGVFGEFTVDQGSRSLFGRGEWQQTETHVLLTGALPDGSHHDETPSPVAALTLGATQNVAARRGFEGAIGAQLTVYRVPELLQSSHGDRPVSFQVFFRLRLPTGSMGRMVNMRMAQGHGMR
jgi:hypothetical protein